LILNKDAVVGIAIIKNQKEWIIGSKNSLPMLSVFKYFVALKVLDKLEKEKISLNKEITINKNMVDEKLYSQMLDKYKTFPFKISIANLLKYMISESDNNACDILIGYAGGTKEIQEYINSIGFVDVEISETEFDMNKEIEKQYLNQARPIDIIRAMKFVRDRNILSDASCKFLDEIMINTTTGKDKLKAGLPQNITLGHKTGSSSRKSNGIKIADNDTGYVFLPDGNVYYIAVMIKDSKMSDEENAKLISSISKITYTHFKK
ncbi:MAG: class A beta-lactamase, partial [Candidatus Gastranaerophilaceae bacterium]